MELVIILLALVIYFIPTMVGWNKKHGAGIFVLNLFFGWLLIGWVGAFIWALCDPKNN